LDKNQSNKSSLRHVLAGKLPVANDANNNSALVASACMAAMAATAARAVRAAGAAAGAAVD
jgi:hypothetical protein